MFVAQQISADFMTKELLQQLGSSFWIGLQRIRNQRDQTLSLTSAVANVYNSSNTKVAGPLSLQIEPDDTAPPLQQAGYLLQTGSGLTITSADTYRVVYTLTNKTGEVGSIQQSFVLRANPF
jgi:hypothetical protein